jgi:hypothetical protein
MLLSNRPRVVWLMLYGLAGMLVTLGARFIGWKITLIRGPFGLEVLFCCPLALIIVLGIPLLIFARLSIYAYRTKLGFLPISSLLIGIFAGFLVAMPARPLLPEETHFRKYRADYEYVVELARKDELEQALPDCPAGYKPPSGYEHVSATHCIFIMRVDNNFMVEFHPFEFYHYVLYAERIPPEKHPCSYDSYMEKQIDEHWFVCSYEWH